MPNDDGGINGSRDRNRGGAVEDEECEYCGGTGEITTWEQVWPGEPHTAPIGTQTCICQLKDEDDHDPDN